MLTTERFERVATAIIEVLEAQHGGPIDPVDLHRAVLAHDPDLGRDEVISVTISLVNRGRLELGLDGRVVLGS